MLCTDTVKYFLLITTSIRCMSYMCGSLTSSSIKTSLNWSHNGSKNYTVDSLSRNRCQRLLANRHTAKTAGKRWWKDDP